MLSRKMEDALNAQINAEFWSAYLYLSMSVHFSAQGLQGMANWFGVQFREEQDHARILIEYVLARNGRVSLAPIAKVPTEWNSPLAAFEDVLTHERKVTEMIDNLCKLSNKEQDFATSDRMIWFVREQVEEEQNALQIIDALKMIEGDKVGVFMVDKELGGRSYSAPGA